MVIILFTDCGMSYLSPGALAFASSSCVHVFSRGATRALPPPTPAPQEAARLATSTTKFSPPGAFLGRTCGENMGKCGENMDETQWKMMDQHEKHGVQRWLNQEKWWTKPKLVVQQRKMLALWSFCGGSIWFHQPTWRTKRDKTNKHGDVNRVMLI